MLPNALAVIAVCVLVLRLIGHRGTPEQVPPPVPVAVDVLSRVLTRVYSASDCERADAGACRQTGQRGVAEPSAAQAIAGASVRVLREHGRQYVPVADGATDAAGGWGAELGAGVHYWLIDAPGRARVSRRVVLDGGARALDVSLAPAVPFRVTVRDDREQPVPGATVLVDGEDALPHGAVTAADGVASFAHVGAKLGALRIEARGFDSVVLQAASRDVTVTLRAPAELAVSVRGPAGEVAAGAEVWLAGFGVWPPRQVQTRDDGVAVLSGLPRGTYDVRARRGGLVSPALVGVEVQSGEKARVDLQLEAGRLVRVRVTDAGGDQPPVAGADVVLAEDGLSPFPLQGRSDADGRVTLGPIPARPATLSVRADGFVPENGVAVPPEAAGELGIALVRGGRLVGRVVDAEGEPVDGARLEVVGNDSRGRPIARHSGSAGIPRGFFERSLGPPLPLVPLGELGVMSGPLPLPGMPALAAAPTSAWATDLEGSYRIEDVPPGRVRVLVRHPDFVEAMSGAVSLEPGGEQRLDVALARGGSLEGRIVDEHDRPIEGARVDAIAPHGTQQKSALTRADGTFAFGGLAPQIDLLVTRPSHRHRFVLRRSLELAPGETRELTLTLPAERPAVSVLVADEANEPLAGARVSLLSLDPAVPLRQTSQTDDAGHAQFEDAAGVAATLRVQAPGYRAFEAQLDKVPERVEVSLERGISISGHVTQVRGRQALSGAEIVLLEDGERRRAVSDADGRYTFEDVATGRVRLTLSHPDFAPRALETPVRATGRDRTFELPDVELEPAGAVSGVVLDAAGEPVAGARVGVGFVPAFLPAGADPSGLSRSDASGRFELRSVPIGKSEISAYAVGAGRGRAEVEVNAGEVTRDVEIRLSGGQSDAEPGALANLAVTLGERERSSRLQVVIVNVAAGSEAERAGLREGDVLLAIDGAPARNMVEARHLLGGSDGSDVILQLERTGEALSLRVRREAVRR